MRRLCLFGLALALGGCAGTRAYIGAEGLHASHLSQHFGPRPTDYGYDALAISFRIEREGAFAELAEGYVLEPRWRRTGLSGAGAMLGPSEITQLTVGYRVRIW